MANWTYEEVIAFTMLYAASADMEITANEEDLIKQKLDEAQYKKVKATFDSSNDAATIDLILSYKDQYFSTDQQRTAVLDEMRKVFDADDQFSLMERNMMKLFKHLL